MKPALTLASRKALLADLWQRAHNSAPPEEWPLVVALTDGPQVEKLPPGFAAFAVGEWRTDNDADVRSDAPPTRHIVVLPALRASAPMSVRHRYLARVVALGSGVCPLCGGVAGLSQEIPDPTSAHPLRGAAAWAALPVYVEVQHSVGCPTTFEDSDKRHFWPSAVGS